MPMQLFFNHQPPRSEHRLQVAQRIFKPVVDYNIVKFADMADLLVGIGKPTGDHFRRILSTFVQAFAQRLL